MRERKFKKAAPTSETQTQTLGFAFLRRLRNKKEMTPAQRREYLFVNMPVWKSLLIMSWPALIQMFVVGAYSFADSLLAIQFADDSYSPILDNSTTDLVRFYMLSVAPIFNLLNSIAVLFSVGMATRISVNLGAGHIERARNILRVGTAVSMAASVLMIPVLVFATKPWIASQFSSYPPELLNDIQEQGFNYIVIIIAGYPIQAFYQVNSGIFRVDGRNRELLIINVLPLFLNLFLDWVLMGPGKMDIEGGAWATFVANAFATVLCAWFIYRAKSDVLRFKYMYGFRARWVVIVAILMAGLTPFIRQFAQSITQIFEQNSLQSVSQAVYGKPQQMTNIASGALIINSLFFPVIFGFTQAVRPLASYNFGAKKFDKVKLSFWITVGYATATAILLYILSAFALAQPLMQLLGVTDENKPKTLTVIRIIMTGMPFFAFAVAGMSFFGSIDRMWFSILSAAMRGFILLFPVMYGIQSAALANATQEFLYWAYYPILSGSTSIVILFMSIYVLKTIHQPSTTFYYYVPRRWVRHVSEHAVVKAWAGQDWVRKEVYYLTIEMRYKKRDEAGNSRLYYPAVCRRVARFDHIDFDERIERVYAWNNARHERALARRAAK